MFNNVGHKIKTVAKIFTWIGIISCVLCGFIIIFSGGNINKMTGVYFGYAASIPSGLAIMIMGSIGSWLLNLTLYGFGELVENSTRIAESQNKQL
jgi:uncharacterized integral membrane protein